MLLENLQKLNVKLHLNEKSVYFPLTHGSHVVGFKKLNSDLTEETFPDKSAKGIIESKRKYDTALIVANIKDFLTLLTYPVACDVICLPNGMLFFKISIFIMTLALLKHYFRSAEFTSRYSAFI